MDYRRGRIIEAAMDDDLETAAALLGMYGVKHILVTKYGWLADTPRAHITNQRAMEVLRDLAEDMGEWAIYAVLAMLALGLHLYHGSWAVVRTLGVAPTSTQPLKRKLALVLAIVVAGGFIVVPVAAVLGLFPDAPAQVDDATVTSTAAAETH
jgi:hypothetical protein